VVLKSIADIIVNIELFRKQKDQWQQDID